MCPKLGDSALPGSSWFGYRTGSEGLQGWAHLTALVTRWAYGIRTASCKGEVWPEFPGMGRILSVSREGIPDRKSVV